MLISLIGVDLSLLLYFGEQAEKLLMYTALDVMHYFHKVIHISTYVIFLYFLLNLSIFKKFPYSAILFFKNVCRILTYRCSMCMKP